MNRTRTLFIGILLSMAALSAFQVFVIAQAPVTNIAPADAELFESKIRPVLAQRCFGCHSSTLAAPKGGLVLNTKAGLLKGGTSGPEIVPGKPAESRLF